VRRRGQYPSCPALGRASTSFFFEAAKTWMAGTSPAMTDRVTSIDMRRRAFIVLLGGAAAAPSLLWPARGARAEQRATRAPRIGVLAPGRSAGADASLVTLNSVVTGLRELGYVEGENIAIERGFGEANADRLREVAAALVRHEPDVIVALSTTAARPLKEATRIIPVVVVAMADPVEDELVASLARPGGNITGTTFLGPELVAKRLQLLSEVVPQSSRVAVLWHPHAYGERTMAGMLKEAENAARILGMQLQFFSAASPEDIEGAFTSMMRDHADALSVFPSPILFAEYGRIAAIAADKKLPAIYAAREGVEAGGLISYGANLPDLARQTALYVDKILKGASPADLPVQQPNKFELLINLKAARALSLTITRDFLVIADEVIE
jgi:putative tryptophan/tyrosine transport system substrate-binding protein